MTCGRMYGGELIHNPAVYADVDMFSGLAGKRQGQIIQRAV